MAKAAGEQAATTAEIVRVVGEVRQRMREVATATTGQSKRAATVAVDAQGVAAKIVQLSRASAEQTQALTALRGMVGVTEAERVGSEDRS